MQASFSNQDEAYTGISPTIALVCTAYSREAAALWVQSQLLDFCLFTGIKEKLTDYQIRNISDIIIASFYALKLSELMVFFFRLKSGHYGRPYGVIDPIWVLESLREFMKERADTLDRIKREAEERERADLYREREQQRARGELMSYAEYLEIAWLFNMGYEK